MYQTVIDQFNPVEWNRLCSAFRGMNIYQVGLYGELHSAGKFRSCSRIAIFNKDQVVAAAQLRIKKIPFFLTGVAEVDWGPLWWPNNGNINSTALEVLLDEIRTEYCNKRGLLVRIRPRSAMSQETDMELHNFFTLHGYCKNYTARPYQTVVIDLDQPLNAIRSRLHQKWRNQLNVAERAGLECERGNSIECFDRFYTIYKAMWNQKRFPTGVRLPIIREMQNTLPQKEKFLVTILRQGQIDIGATVCVALGNTMLYFLGATAPGLRSDCRPGYLLQWLHIQKAKELGMRWYDLGGYDDNSPDLARFKKRTNGLQIVYPGQYEAVPTNWSYNFYENCEKIFRTTRRYIQNH